MDVSVKLTF